MIRDPVVKAEIDKAWTTVAFLISYNRSYVVGSTVMLNEIPPETFYNLPLVLAYATMDDTLGQLIIEDTIKCVKKKGKCFNLGDKMESAKNAIAWINFELVNEGRIARNGLAHESKLVEKYRCIKYIHAVENELRNWGVIS